MSWLLLVIAGVLEVGWAVGLKYTHGFTRPGPTVATVAAMIASLLLLGIALKTLPVATAYAVWVGVGVVGTALLGVCLFGENMSTAKFASLAMIVAGIAGLKLAGGD